MTIKESLSIIECDDERRDFFLKLVELKDVPYVGIPRICTRIRKFRLVGGGAALGNLRAAFEMPSALFNIYNSY